MPGGNAARRRRRVRLGAFRAASHPVADCVSDRRAGRRRRGLRRSARSSSTRSPGSDDVAVGPCARDCGAGLVLRRRDRPTRRRAVARAVQPLRRRRDRRRLACSPTPACRPRSSRASSCRGDPASRCRCTTCAARRSAWRSRCTPAPAGSSPSARPLFDGTDTRKGVAVSLGATGTAGSWRLPFGEVRTVRAVGLDRELRDPAGRGRPSGAVSTACTKLPAQDVDVPRRSSARRRRQQAPGVRLRRRRAIEARHAGRRRGVRRQGDARAGHRGMTAMGTATVSDAVGLRRRPSRRGAATRASSPQPRDRTGDRPALRATRPATPTARQSAPAVAVPPGDRRRSRLGEQASPRPGARRRRRRPDRRRTGDLRPGCVDRSR